MEFNTCSTHYEITEFYQQFRKELPKLVMVSEGYCSKNDDAAFDSGQIIRFHTCSKQRRIKAVAMETGGSPEALYSIPLDHPHPMFIYDANRLGKEKVWKPQLLKDIIENHELPLTVRFASPDTCEDATSAQISTITLRERFDEIFLMGNTIEDGYLNMGIVAAPVKSNGMRIALVLGIHGRTAEEWSQYSTELNTAVVSSISFNHRYGRSGIRLYNQTQALSSHHVRRKTLRNLSRRLSKLFLSGTKVEECTHFPAKTEGDKFCDETSTGFQDYSPLCLMTRDISNYEDIDDSYANVTDDGEALKEASDV